ncbi:hypothetical protein H8S90_13745 [Olivibacter sp. SDN3]|uniref:hypothetical protein n=1 Tax=Olivibacter sp. SDN3 TaxID=2764720 RepID=UPI0016510587|nr:hypothetical protein [Olivibacter sp. SDN3]QNL47882.1 hypothetical protein H8S90_13745 [Olivibacter sp. SDN3]
MKKLSKIAVAVLALFSYIHSAAQIRLDKDITKAKGDLEIFELKKEGKNYQGRDFIIVGNAKNKLDKLPLEVPKVVDQPGYDYPGHYYNINLEEVRALIAPIILAKAGDDENERMEINYYFTPDGAIREIGFVVNEGNPLNIEDFEKMEKILKGNIKIVSKVRGNPYSGVSFVKISDSFKVWKLKNSKPL